MIMETKEDKERTTRKDIPFRTISGLKTQNCPSIFSFPQGFPTVFPDVSVPGKQKVPPNQGISKPIVARQRGGP